MTIATRQHLRTWIQTGIAPVVLTSLICIAAREVDADNKQANQIAFANSNGEARTFSNDGAIDLGNPFFQSLGTNGRACGTCHQPSDGMSVTPDHIQARFDATGGLDPIFRTNDGSNCDHNIDVSNLASRRAAYSMLLTKGVLRISLAVPDTAEFVVSAVDNPYGCSETNVLSVYRRVLPSTNLRFLTTVMWDGRESLPGNSLEQNLKHQAMDATLGHAQGAASPTGSQIQQIVNLEMALSTAQSWHTTAGPLDTQGGNGGPHILSTENFFIGINDPLGPGPFTSVAFTLFNTWQHLNGADSSAFHAARESVSRGEIIFNTRPIPIESVAGLNDRLGVLTINGTCTTCHNTPNVGNHSVPLPIDIGLNDPSHRTPDMPLITLVNKTTGEMVQSMDPARALITGKWKDIGKTKGPILRGLSARAPYFHNGSAATLLDVVNFYDDRFHLTFTAQEKADLVNFLSTL
jgi:cytochrome c peroxidase